VSLPAGHRPTALGWHHWVRRERRRALRQVRHAGRRARPRRAGAAGGRQGRPDRAVVAGERAFVRPRAQVQPTRLFQYQQSLADAVRQGIEAASAQMRRETEQRLLSEVGAAIARERRAASKSERRVCCATCRSSARWSTGGRRCPSWTERTCAATPSTWSPVRECPFLAQLVTPRCAVLGQMLPTDAVFKHRLAGDQASPAAVTATSDSSADQTAS